MQKPLTLGIAGLGTVGAGLLHLLEHHKDRLEERVGRQLRIVGVSARSKDKDRGVKTDGLRWFDDPVALAERSFGWGVRRADRRRGRGGESGRRSGAARRQARRHRQQGAARRARASRSRKLAEERNVALNFEAAVAGGIPVIKTLQGIARAPTR